MTAFIRWTVGTVGTVAALGLAYGWWLMKTVDEATTWSTPR